MFLPSRNRAEAISRVVLPLLIYVLLFAALGALRVRAMNQPPDPNDPNQVGLVDADVLERNLRVANDFLLGRFVKNEIDDEERGQLLSAYARELTAHIDLSAVQANDAWRYADLYRTAKQWDKAEPMFEKAVEWATRTKNEDRRINDTLRLAQSKAHLGKVKDAIVLARGLFDVEPKNKPPLLLAIRLEIVPAGQGKGYDLELAKLVEDAIPQHMQAVVDPRTGAGHAFLIARPHHVAQAWQLARKLYQSGGRPDLAQSLPDRMAKFSETYGAP